MGNVATLFTVYPDTGKEDEVQRLITEQLKPKGMQMEEIAFGIKVLKVMIVHEDTQGSTEFEEKLRKIPGVNNVEVSDESLLCSCMRSFFRIRSSKSMRSYGAV